MKDKRIYISGPMTGHEDYNYPAFDRAAAYVESQGGIPINPARHPIGLEYHEYMAYAVLDVKHADALFMLPFWDESNGAQAEHAIARAMGKEIIYNSFIPEATP